MIIKTKDLTPHTFANKDGCRMKIRYSLRFQSLEFLLIGGVSLLLELLKHPYLLPKFDVLPIGPLALWIGLSPSFAETCVGHSNEGSCVALLHFQ